MHTNFSDHFAIMLNMQSFDQRKKKSGSGFWKFNISLLEDKEYVEKNVWKHSGFNRKLQGCHRSCLALNGMSSRWKLENSRCSAPREQLDQTENQLLIKLNDLQEKLCSSRNDHNLLNEYYKIQAKLKIRKVLSQGNLLRKTHHLRRISIRNAKAC